MDNCQRAFYPEQVQKYIAEHKCLDWKLFGYVTAVRYPNGDLRIINGRHRTSVALTIDPSIKEVPAHIVDVSGPEEAAILFSGMNGVLSKNLKSEEILWSQIIAKDNSALFVQKMLTTCGLACGKVNEFDKQGKPNIQVKLANFEKCLKFGALETELAVKLIKKAYPKARGEIDNLLSGTTRLITLDAYKTLGNTQLEIGKRFETWFTTILPNAKTLKQTNFKKYHNTTQWYNGVAFGLYELFYVFIKNNEWTCPPIKTVKEIYEAGIRDDEDEE
jgi:hypothetical protein